MKSPAYNVIAVPIDRIEANDYNPNIVASPELKLLELSIWEDGYTQPVVCYHDTDKDRYVLVDGYHRYRVMQTSRRIFKRENGLLPVVVIAKPLSERMASTIRHNRARGEHQLQRMSAIIAALIADGQSDAWIAKHLGMDADELLRLKQISGIAELFADRDFSASWE